MGDINFCQHVAISFPFLPTFQLQPSERASEQGARYTDIKLGTRSTMLSLPFLTLSHIPQRNSRSGEGGSSVPLLIAWQEKNRKDLSRFTLPPSSRSTD